MEDQEAPLGGSPAWANITGIQFGLMTTANILKLSVAVNHEASGRPKDVINPYLGLPTASGPCLTCNGITVDQCQGHFGHIHLPIPIFHPNHVETLVRVLRKICLNCGQLRKKRKHLLALPASVKQDKDLNSRTGPDNQSKKRKRRNTLDPDHDSKGLSSTPDAKSKQMVEYALDEKHDNWAESSIKGDSPKNLFVLSSDSSEDDLDYKSKNVRKVRDHQDPRASTLKVAEVIPDDSKKKTRKRKSVNDLSGFTSKAASKDAESNITVKAVGARRVGRPRKVKENSHQIDKNANKIGDNFKSSSKKIKELSSPNTVCKYCSASSRRLGYPEPEIRVHVRSKGASKEDPLVMAMVKVIKMTVNPDDHEDVAVDFWNFVEGPSQSNHRNKKGSRYLLPSEALKILKKIPQKNIAGLGMEADVARPEGLILECIPIPPNCTRLLEDGSNIGFKMGVDRGTQAFERLLRKVHSIKSSRFSNPVFQAALSEFSVLQALFQQYLREKGAPKSAPGAEKKRVDQSGRLQKRASRWSLDWLKNNIIGKRSGYSARNVVTGDPFLSVEEIGVPLDIAKHVTCSERVTEFNRSILQKYVGIGQDLSDSRACGAVRIVTDGERREVTRKTEIDLQLGNVVHRHLKDGDLVFINRPPSLHKHSLLALKVRIHTQGTWTINPAVCAPLHADFDGDCLHVFIPQNEESKAELHELMTLPSQILPSPDERTILGLSQDYILAAYLVTFSPVFLTREEMHQLGLWTTKQIPAPAIIKSPRGPLWTGKQVIDLTIPDKLSFQSESRSTIIHDGEILSCGENQNWLASTKGLVRIIALYNAAAAVEHLDCSQSILREWLLTHGFSVSLEDFYAAPDQRRRRKMKREIDDSLANAKSMAVGKQLIFEKKIQKEDRLGSGRCNTRKLHDLGDVAVTSFRHSQSQIGDKLVESISENNCLIAMLRSGSKGSNAKVMQQIGSLGIQVVNGNKLLSAYKNPKLVAIAAAMGYSSDDNELQDVWETRGLVKSSLLDGLEPHEFFIHAMSVRDGIFRQSQEIAGPGELFKKLMLFLRDVYIAYDGTVRNRGGLEIIQYRYEGANSLMEEDTSFQGTETVLPGEPVGILAATAISQPAYQIMLEASPCVGSRKIRPLDLLQESTFPRGLAKLKASDRRCILRLSRCGCDEKYCDERRILSLQTELKPVTVEMLATEIAIEYACESSKRWETFDFDTKTIKRNQLLPWVGHIQLDKMLSIENQITPAMILEKLGRNRGSQLRQKGFKQKSTRQPHLFFESPEREKQPCLHFTLLRDRRKKLRTRGGKKQTDDETAEIIDTIKSVVIPMILNTVVKGFEKIESSVIVWENKAWSPPQIRMEKNTSLEESIGELVLEVTVKEVYCTRRGMPWRVIQESCLRVMDYIDWKRSSPYSIQEVKTIFGVDAGQNVLAQRLELAAGDHVGKKHLKLVADLMAHSGEIHGLTSYGYKDWMRNLQIPTPFTAGVFRAPMRNFMEAGRKGFAESFKGVLASSVFGKKVPLGTGSDFMVNLNLKPVHPLTSKIESSCSAETDLRQPIDILERLVELNSAIAAKYPPEASITHEEHAFDSPQAEAECEWGASARVSESEGAWGACENSTKIPIVASGSSAVDEIDTNGTDVWGTNNKGSFESDSQNCLSSSGGWGSSHNRSKTSPILTSGSFGVDEKYQSHIVRRESDSQWGSQNAITAPGDGWGSSNLSDIKEKETKQTDVWESINSEPQWESQNVTAPGDGWASSNLSGSLGIKEKETQQTDAWGCSNSRSQSEFQNVKLLGGMSSTEAETLVPSSTWGFQEKDTNETSGWGSTNRNSQWESQTVVTVPEPGSGWGSAETEISKPSGNWD